MGGSLVGLLLMGGWVVGFVPGGLVAPMVVRLPNGLVLGVCCEHGCC